MTPTLTTVGAVRPGDVVHVGSSWYRIDTVGVGRDRDVRLTCGTRRFDLPADREIQVQR